MRTRQCTMTLLLAWTLLSNLGHYERGSVAASGEDDRNEVISKRRILERLIRLGLASSDRQAFRLQSSQQHLYPASASEISNDPASPLEISNAGFQTFRPSGSALLQWFHSNQIPSSNRNPEEGDSSQHSFPIHSENNSYFAKELSNLFYPMSSGSQSSLPLLLRQHDLTETVKDSALRRRHAEEGETITNLSPKELKKQRKAERQKKREEKKNLRNKEKQKKKIKNKNKRLQEILKDKDIILHNIDGEEYIDCCPSKLIVVEKQVGKDRNNHAVEVRPSQQYFYERVCLQDIEGKECVFPAKSLKKGVLTRCAQQFSYVQAQVRPYRSDVDWHLDYIHVRSGCSCQVSVSPKKKKNV